LQKTLLIYITAFGYNSMSKLWDQSDDVYKTAKKPLLG